jgi:hypothetical protein
MHRRHAHDGVRRIGMDLGVAAGAVVAAALAGSPLAYADTYDLEPVGSGTVLSDTGIPDVFGVGQVTQEIAEYDVTTGEVATGAQAGSLDVTENIFTSPLGSIGFIDGANATDGTGIYADDAGNASAYDLVISGPSGGEEEFGNIPLGDFDLSQIANAAAAVPVDDLGLSGLGLDSLAPGLDSLLSLF